MKDLSHDPLPAEAPTLDWNGTTYRVLLSTADSGGAMCIVESTSPARSGPPRHVHRAEDEAFVVLSGEMQVGLAGRTVRLGPGGSAFVPRGVEHTFRALSECRHLVILTPGGFEGFFAEMAAGAFRIPEDLGAIRESAARHALDFTGPPL